MSLLCVAGHTTLWCQYCVLQVTALSDVLCVACHTTWWCQYCMLQVIPSSDVSIVCCRSHNMVMSVLYVAGHPIQWCQYCMLQVTPSSDVSIVCCRSPHPVMSVLYVAGHTIWWCQYCLLQVTPPTTQLHKVPGYERPGGKEQPAAMIIDCAAKSDLTMVSATEVCHMFVIVFLCFFLIAWNNYAVPTKESVCVILTVSLLKRERHWEYTALYHN